MESVAISLPDETIAPEGSGAALAPLTQALHVLVVDDVLMNRDIASSFIRAAGHKATCVESGTEAIEAVVAMEFDVVLMDVRMPGMDGLEATRRIRALQSDRRRIPIVALTAQAFTDQIAECLKAGMDSHLAKPFDPDTLLTAIVHAGNARLRQSEDRLASMRTAVPIRPPDPAIGWEPPVVTEAAVGIRLRASLTES
jgi:CheY-like chemotaxis protein